MPVNVAPRVPPQSAHTHTRTHTRTHVRTHTHTHAHTLTRTHAHTYTRTPRHTHTRTHARTPTRTQAHTHTRAHAHTRTHSHEAVVPPHRGELKPSNGRTSLKKVVPFSGAENGVGYANSLGNSNRGAVFRARKTAPVFFRAVRPVVNFSASGGRRKRRGRQPRFLPRPGPVDGGCRIQPEAPSYTRTTKGRVGPEEGGQDRGRSSLLQKGRTKRRVGAERGVQDQQPKAPTRPKELQRGGWVQRMGVQEPAMGR